MSKRMESVKNLKGMQFGRLLVLDVDERKKRKTYWRCLCACGNEKMVRSDVLQEGRTKSCGCLKKEQDTVNLTANHSHKQSGTRLYYTWQGMKSRCYNDSDGSYERYGGRGIVVCDEWLNDFGTFYKWAIANNYSQDLTIERIDNSGNYEPNNCRFATMREQSNNRRSNIVLHIAGVDYTLTQICEYLDLPFSSIWARYSRGTRGLDLIKPIR